jgi:catechol 2,3-dioxygenase-like lactoylglutathione lyase family enzyme
MTTKPADLFALDARLRRRDLLALAALALPARAQSSTPLFTVAALDHINIRASDPTKSAHFYQSLFGGELQWIAKIPPNPTSPAAESWYLMLGLHFLSISPTFPNLNLGAGLDHISPALRDYQPAAATAKLKERGLKVEAGGGVWVHDPDGFLYQLRDDRKGGPARPPGLAKPKAGDTAAPAAAPFAPVGIREIRLRVADVNKSAAFYEGVFGVAAGSPDAHGMRRFRFGDSGLALIPAGGSNAGTMERLAIAVKDFSAGSARRTLRGRHIDLLGTDGEVIIADPDGIHVQLVQPARS